MATTVKNGELVVAPNTNEQEIQFTDAAAFPIILTAFIEVVSGTIQFSSGESIAAAHRAWPAGSKFPMSFKHPNRNIRYKAANAAETFVITI
jgi:hypothetical protein